MRALVKIQGIVVRKHEHALIEEFLETVRQQFRSIVAQEKERLAAMNFPLRTNASEHLRPLGDEEILQFPDVTAISK